MVRRFSPVLLVVALLFSACTDNLVLVTVPPKAPVEGIHRILVLPFENFSSDPGLAREFELRLVEEIRASEWYEFVDSERTRNLLFQYGYTLDDLKIEANRARIAQDLRIDAIIVGEATYYFDDVYLGPVGCAACQSPLQRSWFVEQFTTVAVHVTARMINLHTGQEVHFLRAVGEEWSTLRIPISWEGDANNPPPPAFIPNPNRQQIPQTRSAAIESAVKAFARDILPTQEWTLAR